MTGPSDVHPSARAPEVGDDKTDPFGGPLRHLERAAPPWVTGRHTICGRPLNDVGAWLPFDEAAVLIRKVGHARAQFLFCQTCLSRHQTSVASPGRWARDPCQITADWASRAGWQGERDNGVSAAHLLALSDLWERHRDEYEALLAIRQTPDTLAERRKAKRQGNR